MKLSRAAGVCVVLALLAPAQEQTLAARVSCDGLASLRLPNATVTSATEVAAGAFTPPTAPGRGVAPALARRWRRCSRSAASQITSKPTADSDIKIEVWLPARSWNGKFQAVGNGGWAGTIPYAAMAAAMARGYATASTDSGHTTPGASFAVGHPEKLVDYAHRSLHEMAVNAKVIVDAYYGKPADGLGVERLLHRRKPGADARVDVPERLRCDRRRRATGHPIARARRASRAASHRASHGRQLHSAREISGRSQSGDGCVRSEGRRERRHHRKSSGVPLRSEGAAVHGCGRPVVPHRRAGRDRARAVLGHQASENGSGAVLAAAAAGIGAAVGNAGGTAAVLERERNIQVPRRARIRHGIRRGSTRRPMSRRWTRPRRC